MSDTPKKITKKIRERLHADIEERISRLELQQHNEHKHQINLITEFREKLKNSGTLYLSEKEVLTKLFSGLKIYLDPRDIAVAQHIALDFIWEEEITKAWLSVLKPADVVLDIGANFGYFGLLAGQFTDRKKAKIVFFEANPNLIPYINKSLSSNWLHEQSKVENYAVSDSPGKLTLNVLKDYIGSSGFQTMEHLESYMHEQMKLEVKEKIQVNALTIDDYCKENKIGAVNLIKMDIEGYEEKAYRGMRKIVKASPDITMFVEFTADSYDDPKRLYEQMLSDFGYVYLISADGSIEKPQSTAYSQTIGASDRWVMPIFSKNANLSRQ